MPLLQAQEPTAQSLIDAHDAAVKSLRSGDVQLRVRGLHRATGQFRDSFTFRWRWDGLRERIAVLHHQTSVSADIERLRRDDILLDNDEWRFLYNYDPDGSVSVDPGDQNGVAATLAPPGVYGFMDPAAYCLLRFGLSNGDIARPLRELTRRMREVSLVGTDRTFGTDSEAWRLHFTLGEKTNSLEPESLDVWIDPDRGFQVVQLMKDYGAVAGNGGLENMTSYVTAEAFSSFGQGVVLPVLLIERSAIGNGEPEIIGRTEMSIESINAPVDEAVFQMPFPEGLYVADDRSVADGVEKWFVWGADDHAALEIAEPAEYRRAFLDQREGQRSGSVARTMIFWAANASALVVVVWYVTTKWRRRVKH
ncbi:MAG: hypothetical protein R3C19_09415 [Planctomycetaceae bacterium]